MSKLELVRYTNINDARIRVVPLFAGNCVDIKVGEEEQENILAKYKLEKHQFFFYPAQFWAHKNHAILLRAFAEYVSLYPDYKLVLTGSDQGNLKYIRSLSHQLKIENNVLFLDFVSIELIHTFYRNTTALVMASYLGPTNIPPIEAMELGCPVICSDIEGHHEILSDSAIYFDPMSESELYEALLKMNDNYTLYMDLILKQKEISLFRINHSLSKINDCLKEVSIIRNCWE
jgi:glycosyltransferase involved in cell wall biosynthesis